MKYAILVGDGMADIPIASLGDKTPIEYANTPAMDFISKHGKSGMVATIPDGFEPGSDVANMSLMGYAPQKYYSGRAPIEAASLELPLAKSDTAFRCNLVYLKDGKMADYSSGHIETEDSVELIHEISETLNNDMLTFFSGTSYRHIIIHKDFPDEMICTPPHDITDRFFESHLPRGTGREIILDLMLKARKILAASEINKKRIANNKIPATDIWVWGHGKTKTFPTMQNRYGLSGSVISAVDLVRGLGKLAGLDVIKVPGATGYLGTNYAGKISAAKKALSYQDFIYLHLEAPDETSHEGSLHKKLQAIEEFDKEIVKPMVALQKKMQELRLIVLPDHPTLISTKTHDASPVPFAVCGKGIVADNSSAYSEKSGKIYAAKEYTGTTLFNEFIHGNF